MAKKLRTNQQLFKELLDQNIMFVAVLREALNHYDELIKEWEPTEKELNRSFVEPNYWKQCVAECKTTLDNLYANNR